MTLRTSLQRLIGRDPARLSLRERAAETAARLASSKPATDAATADPPPQIKPDAVLTEAAADLQRAEATIAAIPAAPGQDLDDVPGYGILDAEADRAADVLASTPADGLIGLRAKAAAILSDRFSIQSPQALEMAQSLARDVLGTPPVERRPLPAPDSPEALTQFEAACREHGCRVARSSHAAQVRGRTVPRNVALTVPPGRHGPFRMHPPWRVVAAIQEAIAAR